MDISFGKYKGTLFEDIIKNDKQYIEWLCTTKWFQTRLEHRKSYEKCLELLNIENKKIQKNKTDDILVYTDGACSNNGYDNAVCGIGVYFSERNKTKYENIEKVILDIDKSTNNIAELIAILEALKSIKNNYKNEKIKLYTDSHYCLKTLKKWYKEWIKDGSLNTRKNIDIIKNIYDNYYTQMNIELFYIKGHSKQKDEHSIGNDIADKLARESTYNYKKNIL